MFSSLFTKHNVVKGQAFMRALHKDKSNPVNIYFI